MEFVNLVLFFLSISLMGVVKIYEGWKNFFVAFGLWSLTLALFGLAMGILRIDADLYKIWGCGLFVVIDLVFLVRFFKRGYHLLFLGK